jgi:hypothetical protein
MHGGSPEPSTGDGFGLIIFFLTKKLLSLKSVQYDLKDIQLKFGHCRKMFDFLNGSSLGYIG